MITVKQYELHESVKALERAPLRLEILTRRVELDGEEINASAWQERANCRGADPNLFFPGQGGSTREAKAMCAACEVRDDCLEFAVTEGERMIGIWGGLSERERRKIRGQRTRAKALQVPWLVGRKSD